MSRKIRLIAKLLPPSNLMYIGGSNMHIFSLGCNLEELQLPDHSIFDLLGGFIPVNGVMCRVTMLNRKSKIILLEGFMSSANKRHIKELISDGWKFHEDAAKHHNIKVA